MYRLLFLFALAPSIICSAQMTPLPDPGKKANELVWMHPTQTQASVQANEYVEIGFKLQQEAKKRIDNYLKERNVPGLINPFDARDLDVVFTFSLMAEGGKVGELSKQVNGFFYREYIRDRSNSDPNMWKHVEKPTLFHIRGRFTPTQPGTYCVQATIKAKGMADTKTDVTYFEVQAAVEPGFLEIGENKRFFEQGESSFFPVGQNIPWPDCNPTVDPLCKTIQCGGIEPWCGGKLTSLHSYDVYQKQMTDLANAGGNYMRLLIAPWNLDIEFEKLNNYNDRLNRAWELDRIIQKADDLDLLLHLNLHVHYPLEETSVYSMFCWDYADIDCYGDDDPYCYVDELGLKTPKDFLESKEAMIHYKNRIRYLIARYGYSTSIGVIELFSEANNIGQATGVNEECLLDGSLPNKHPYHRQEGYAALVGDWQQQIAEFIKVELNHTEHIISANYTGTPEFTKGDDTFYSPYVDLATWNNYTLSINKYYNITRDVSNFQSKRQKGNITKEDPPFLDKPIMFSEIGPGAAEVENCDNNLRWIKAAWKSSFSGLAGTGMNWSEQWNPELWTHLGRIHELMKQVDLDNGEFTSVAGIRADNKVDYNALVSSNGSKKAVGVLHNGTVNFYTRREENDCVCSDLDKWGSIVLFEEYREARSMEPSRGKNALSLPKMGVLNRYQIEWYDVDTGQKIAESMERSSPGGKLELVHPTMSKDKSPLMYFKVYRLKSEGF